MIFEKLFCLLVGVKHLFTLHAGSQKIVKQMSVNSQRQFDMVTCLVYKSLSLKRCN